MNYEVLSNKSTNFFLIAGPCVIESEQLCFDVASHIIEITTKLNIPYIFKASYRKANRSSKNSFKGIGDEAGLAVLQKIKEDLHIPIITDIHLPEEAALASSYGIDILQIPAFLCRQTDLLEAAAQTGKIVNIKKGQFLSPEVMKFVAEKVESYGNQKIILTERGVSFGYHDLLVDYRGIPTMQQFGYPVVLDVTHSLQQPNQIGGVTGGRPDMIATLSKAAIAIGTDGLFMETHPEPSTAKSDGANMLPLHELESLLNSLVKIRQAII